MFFWLAPLDGSHGLHVLSSLPAELNAFSCSPHPFTIAATYRKECQTDCYCTFFYCTQDTTVYDPM